MKHWRPNRPSVLVLAAVVLACASAIAQPAAPATQPNPVVEQVRLLLTQGKLPEAIKLTETELKRSPGDASVLSAYVELRMALVRQMLGAQKFAGAEPLLKQVLAADPRHATAGKILESITQARGRVAQSLTDATELARLERFEQAAAILAQVAGLLPDEPGRWKQAWITAAVGAGDDQYLMRNYEAALPFYTQALELTGDKVDQAGQPLLSRWSHCYAMNIGRSANLPRTPGAWMAIIEEAKDRVAGAQAGSVGQFLAAIGRDAMGDYPAAVQSYRDLLGPNAGPAAGPGVTPAAEAAALRTKAVAAMDTLYQGASIDRRGGAWAAVLPGQPLTRRSEKWPITVTAHNDLAARRVLEAAEYHAPRLAAYFGGTEADLTWPVRYQITVQPKADAEHGLADRTVPSYTQVQVVNGRLTKLETVCHQFDPLLLGATLPHEMSHAIVAKQTGYVQIPIALDEGLAIQAETTPRYLMFRRELVSTGGPRFKAAQLLAMEQMPKGVPQTRMYSEFYHLVAWLLTRDKPAKVVELARAAGVDREHAMDALVKIYGFEDAAASEKAYRTFLQDQRLIAAEPTPKPDPAPKGK